MFIQTPNVSGSGSRVLCLLVSSWLILGLSGVAFGHALGNFTINHFARLSIGGQRVMVHYVVDLAEIPALQELQAADPRGNGTPTSEELNAYLQRAVAAYAHNLLLTVDDKRLQLKPVNLQFSLPVGEGGLSTLRMECDYESAPLGEGAQNGGRLRFEDTNHRDRLGWHEIVVVSAEGMTIFDSTAYGNAVTDELKSYPENLSPGPLNERSAELSFSKGEIPLNAIALRQRDATFTASQTSAGQAAASPKGLAADSSAMINRSRDQLTELIAVPTLTPMVALLGLLIATGLGGLHAMSPGHGKTVVGAYLVGSRGNARHAAFLGLTVTITHTLGVFALGLVTLFAAQYVLPETLFPILSLVSGAIVLAIGLSLFVRRLRAVLANRASRGHDKHSHAHDHTHDHSHLGGDHEHGHAHHEHSNAPHGHTHAAHDHSHEHDHSLDPSMPHSHGGRMHTHLPPGADGSPVTWRSLLALGISGGLLPCPSALVVLLAAIALHRVGYGLLLVVAFSVGLAATLTAVGLVFVYAGRLLKRTTLAGAPLFKILPVVSAFVIACAGAVICYQAIEQSGINLRSLWAGMDAQAIPVSTASVLLFGFVFGIKHAVEADHLAAVSTIVSERKSLFSSTLIGGLWGIGHTISLLVVGVIVIVLNIEIGQRLALALEFGVALMLIGLGLNGLRKLARGSKLHVHQHQHFGHAHLHPHLHDPVPEIEINTHHGLRFGARPLLVGTVHGLAGSAALMLLVLSTITSQLAGMAYIVVFGAGSIGGMMLMSAIVSLPARFTASRFRYAPRVMLGLAGGFSLCFGLFMAYEIGFVDGLFLSTLTAAR